MVETIGARLIEAVNKLRGLGTVETISVGLIDGADELRGLGIGETLGETDGKVTDPDVTETGGLGVREPDEDGITTIIEDEADNVSEMELSGE
jgi:hypothetical protein